MDKMTDEQKDGLLEGMEELDLKDCLLFITTNGGKNIIFPHGDQEYLARVIATIAGQNDDLFYYLVTIVGGAAQIRGITFKMVDPHPPIKPKDGATA